MLIQDISDIEDLVSKNVSVLIVNPVDSDAVTGAVQVAVDSGVKVISVDRVVNNVEIDCQIASDNVAGAEMATRYIVDTLGEGVKVAELQGISGASAAVDRGEGFHNIADAGKDILVVGFDATDDAIAAIKEGRMAATIAQQPALIGSTAVEQELVLVGGDSNYNSSKSYSDYKGERTVIGIEKRRL